jgi:hypothetical protein
MNYILIQPFIYKNKYIKLNLKCNICNHEWKSSYCNLINNNSSCPKCGIQKAINTCIERYGEAWLKYVPSYNPNSIIYLDMISKKLNLPIQHALNGGEKKFVKYWVDGYIEQYNICIEWDEKYHNIKKNKEKDTKREEHIINNFNCKIIRINEKEFLKDIDNQINIICDKINKIINNIELNNK